MLYGPDPIRFKKRSQKSRAGHRRAQSAGGSGMSCLRPSSQGLTVGQGATGDLGKWSRLMMKPLRTKPEIGAGKYMHGPYG